MTDLGSMSAQELIAVIEDMRQQRRYGLVWDDDRVKEVFEADSENAWPVIEDVPLRAIIQDRTKRSHVLIEGDNYHSLTALQCTHLEAVDVIYIDPPYNTGHRDFRYNDRYVDEEDSYRHSKWLSFMRRRLVLAQRLLKETGVMFISIDDNEYARLSLLCESIFGVANVVGTIVWRRRSGSNDVANRLSSDHEYVLVIAKNNGQCRFHGVDKDLTKYQNPDGDPRGPWTVSPLTCNKTRAERPNLYYPITDPKTGITFECSTTRVWAYERARMERLICEGKIMFPTSPDGRPSYKRHLAELRSTLKPASTWAVDVPLNAEGTKELRAILGECAFAYPKPIGLIKYLIGLVDGPGITVLDFFAGSGTTLHAVQELNAADDGDRICILATNDEGGICTEVCLPRVRGVLQGYTDPRGQRVRGLGGNLHYMKTTFVPRHRNSDAAKRDIAPYCVDLLALKENTFEAAIETASFTILEGATAVVGIYLSISGKAWPDLIERMVSMHPKEKKIHCFTFSDAALPSAPPGFAVLPIPSQILKLYDEAAVLTRDI